MTEEVVFSTSENGVGIIRLNRPKALNSLTFNMVKVIRKKLQEWSTCEAVKVVAMRGTGDRGFCAGGDIKSVYEARNGKNELQEMRDFFAAEYAMDLEVANFNKPIIALLNGIVMGGGVGLSYGANIKIVTNRTLWAMPEMTIGFFPDVGAAYFLNKAPGFIGRFLALTATQINATDVLYINAASHFMSDEKGDAFLTALESIELTDANIDDLLEQHVAEPTVTGKLASVQKEIDSHFSFSTIEEIIQSLEKSDSTFAVETLETMKSKSPVSLKVTLKQLLKGQHQSLEECLTTDLVLASNFIQHPDFFEGIRSVVIDKDLKPNYHYKTLSDVSEDFINQFFVEK